MRQDESRSEKAPWAYEAISLRHESQVEIQFLHVRELALSELDLDCFCVFELLNNFQVDSDHANTLISSLCKSRNASSLASTS